MSNKGGRPRTEIDRKQFEKLCSIQCTLSEIASFFDCSEDTIERWCESEYEKGFAEIFRIKRGIGKISLRRSQFQMAEKNPTMAIWLGKQYLGQKDNIGVDVEVANKSDEVESLDEYFRQRKQEGTT